MILGSYILFAVIIPFILSFYRLFFYFRCFVLLLQPRTILQSAGITEEERLLCDKFQYFSHMKIGLLRFSSLFRF